MARGFGATHGVGTTDRAITAVTTAPTGGDLYWTITCWVRRLGSGGSGHQNVVLGFSNTFLVSVNEFGRLRCQIDYTTSDGAWNIGSPNLNDNNWHHIAITIPTTTANVPRFFVDGAEVAINTTESTPSGSLNLGTGEWCFGGLSTGTTNHFEGALMWGGAHSCRLGDAIIRSLADGKCAYDYYEDIELLVSANDDIDEIVADGAITLTGTAVYATDLPTVYGSIVYDETAYEYIGTATDSDDSGDAAYTPATPFVAPFDSATYAWTDNGVTISGATTLAPTLTLDVGTHILTLTATTTRQTASRSIRVHVYGQTERAAPVTKVRNHFNWIEPGGVLMTAAKAAVIDCYYGTPGQEGGRDDSAQVYLDNAPANGVLRAYRGFAQQQDLSGFGSRHFYDTGAVSAASYEKYQTDYPNFYFTDVDGNALERVVGTTEYYVETNPTWTAAIIPLIATAMAWEAPSHGGDQPWLDKAFTQDNLYTDLQWIVDDTEATSFNDIRHVTRNQHLRELTYDYLRDLYAEYGLLTGSDPRGMGTNFVQVGLSNTQYGRDLAFLGVWHDHYFYEALNWDFSTAAFPTSNELEDILDNLTRLIDAGIDISFNVITDDFPPDATAVRKVAWTQALYMLLAVGNRITMRFCDNTSYNTLFPDASEAATFPWNADMGAPAGGWSRDGDTFTRTFAGDATATLDNTSSSEDGDLNTAPVITDPGAYSWTEDSAITPDTLEVTDQDGDSTFTFSVESGAFPTGVSINSGTGQITGTPTVTGNWAATVRATDSGGAYGEVALSGNVAESGGTTGATSDEETDLFLITGVID